MVQRIMVSRIEWQQANRLAKCLNHYFKVCRSQQVECLAGFREFGEVCLLQEGNIAEPVSEQAVAQKKMPLDSVGAC